MRTLALAPLLLMTALLAGCTSDDGAGGGATTTSGGHATSSSSHATGQGERMVHLIDDEFQDGDLTISVGTSVKYMNTGQRPHTVTIHWVGEPANVTRLDRTLQPGQDITYNFDQAGTYHVWCRFHGTMTSGMASTVTVN